MEQKVTTDVILGWLKERVESKQPIAQDAWLDAAFKLNLLEEYEVHDAEILRQAVATMKHEILKAQEKKNVSAAEIEVEASDEYRLWREQDAKVERIKEFIRIAKRNADRSY